MARHKNSDWQLPGPRIGTWEQVGIAVLMDIRDELQSIGLQQTRLLNILECRNFQNIPRILRAIARNTARHRCLVGRCPRTFDTARGLRQHERVAHAPGHLRAVS
jgi:hypothetical protein